MRVFSISTLQKTLKGSAGNSKSMDEYWNEMNLSMPALINFEISRRKFNIEAFKKLFEDAINYFTQLGDFEAEIEQISRFIYLEREPFRMMKGYQEMKKTQQAAHRYQRMDILGILETFNSFISDDLKAIVSIPYRQNLDYVLIKLQGLSKLLIRIITCARNSARYFLGLIRHGSFYVKGTVFVASLAKVWDISRSMCTYTVMIYDKLMSYRDQLKYGDSMKWMANNCSLPLQLDNWLGDEFLEFVVNETCEFKMLTTKEEIENFQANRENNFNIFGCVKEEKKIEQVSMSLQDIKIESHDVNELEDYTPISRNIKVDEISYNHSISSITSKDHVKLFIKTEDKYRKVDVKNSLTIKKANNKTWKNFKSDLKTKLMLMQENRLIEYFNDHVNEFLQ